jgi:hypothetical protein
VKFWKICFVFSFSFCGVSTLDGSGSEIENAPSDRQPKLQRLSWELKKRPMELVNHEVESPSIPKRTSWRPRLRAKVDSSTLATRHSRQHPIFFFCSLGSASKSKRLASKKKMGANSTVYLDSIRFKSTSKRCCVCFAIHSCYF